MLDVLIVSLGSTGGLRAADEELLASLRRAGASADIVRAEPPRPVRTLMLTDLRWALAARRAVKTELGRTHARALIYSTTTTALLWPRPGAIRFDAPAAGNRPGHHGLWQRPLERRRLREAPLLLPQSEGALLETPAAVRRSLSPDGALVLPVPVESSGPHEGVESSARHAPGEPLAPHEPHEPHEPLAGHEPHAPVESPGQPAPVKPSVPHAPRDVAAVTYAANPAKKGLDTLLDAWRQVRGPGEELYVTGVGESELRSLGIDVPAQGVRVTGMLPQDEYRALLRRSHTYVCAARREDYGIAQLEALAEGCMLVTTPSPGPYAALALALALDERLVDEDIGVALRTALDDPLPHYAERALRKLAPFRRDAVDRIVAEELLPRLLS